MIWDDDTKFLDTAKLTKKFNLEKKIEELRKIRKQKIDEIESRLKKELSFFHDIT